MIRKVQTYEITCDTMHCGTKQYVMSTFGQPGLPDGWMRETTSGWGMTGYDNTQIYCPACKERKGKEKAKAT